MKHLILFFNIFAVLVMSIFTSLVVWRQSLHEPLVWTALIFIGGVAGWQNYIAARHPRLFTYGAQEYLQESELAHVREMAKLEIMKRHDDADQRSV